MNITVYLGANEGNAHAYEKQLRNGGMDWEQWKCTNLWWLQIWNDGCNCEKQRGCISGELDGTSIGFSDKSSGGKKSKIYNLDMVLSVGYCVNSKRGIAFRRWADSVLK